MSEETPTLEVFKQIVENVVDLFRKTPTQDDYTLAGPSDS